MRQHKAQPFDAVSGKVDKLSPLIERVLCGNASPFTYTGTCSYIVGLRDVVVIDPGPRDEKHLGVLVKALEGRRVRAILVTHTHKDHSSLARALQHEVGGDILAFGSHTLARPELRDEVDGYRGSGDEAFYPDVCLKDGALIPYDGGELRAIHTPGHTANHLCFAVQGTPWLFSGDQVMGWSTTVVAPPDGSMTDYMLSMDKLLALPYEHYLPGHGGEVREAKEYVRLLLAHRKQREMAILSCLREGIDRVPDIVNKLYKGLPETLVMGARFTVLAHLDRLLESGDIVSDGDLSLMAHYRPVLTN